MENQILQTEEEEEEKAEKENDCVEGNPLFLFVGYITFQAFRYVPGPTHLGTWTLLYTRVHAGMCERWRKRQRQVTSSALLSPTYAIIDSKNRQSGKSIG